MTERDAFEQWYCNWWIASHPETPRWCVYEWLLLDEDENYTDKTIVAQYAAWQESRQQALEESALICDGLRDDAKEAEVLAKWRAAENENADESVQLRLAQFWLDVSTFNAGLRRAADAIRSLTSPTGDKA